MKINESEKSHRKPYLADMPTNWWSKLRYYLFYIVRESTAFFMLWISIVLMYGVICAQVNEVGRDEFYRFIFFLQNPIVIVINILALIAALIHSFTWFNLAPKATNIIFAGKKLSAAPMVIGFWLITVIVSATLLLLVLGYFR